MILGRAIYSSGERIGRGAGTACCSSIIPLRQMLGRCWLAACPQDACADGAASPPICILADPHSGRHPNCSSTSDGSCAACAGDFWAAGGAGCGFVRERKMSCCCNCAFEASWRCGSHGAVTAAGLGVATALAFTSSAASSAMAGCLEIVSSFSSHRLFFLNATCTKGSENKVFP
jgi:hypothetical protein